MDTPHNPWTVDPPPTLGRELVTYFTLANAKQADDGEKQPAFRSVLDFCRAHSDVHQAHVLAAVGRLVDRGFLLAVQGDGFAYHTCYIRNRAVPDGAEEVYDFAVGGFPEIRRQRAKSVLQLEVTHQNGDADSGSAFLIAEQIAVTAKHCIDGVRSASIVDPTDSDARIDVVSIQPSPLADFAILVIEPQPDLGYFRIGTPRHLDRVMAMGYPKLEGLLPALVTSTGEVAGTAKGYLDGGDYWLTTCALTGASSGGPVVNERGEVVGIVSALPVDDADLRSAPFGLMVSPSDGLSSLTAASKDA